MTTDLQPDYARELIQRFATTGDALDAQYARARDAGYWAELSSRHREGHLERPSWDALVPVDPSAVRLAIDEYAAVGYSVLRAAVRRQQAVRMRRIVEAVRRADWPPVFSYVYDDFWLVGDAAPLRQLLGEILGPRYVILPRIWAHFVSPHSGRTGWAPHLDGGKQSEPTLSVWVPLSDATVSNGCMHVVRRTPQTEALCTNYHELETFNRGDVATLLQNVRALPARPGDVLCWDERVLHWGGWSSPGSRPRVSIALEFRAPSHVDVAADDAGVDPSSPPPFELRLALIGRAILEYRRFEPLVERFVPLAAKLCGVTT